MFHPAATDYKDKIHDMDRFKIGWYLRRLRLISSLCTDQSLLQHAHRNCKKAHNPQQHLYSSGLAPCPLPGIIDNDITAHDPCRSTNVRLHYGRISRGTSARARHLDRLSFYRCGGRSVGRVCRCGGMGIARCRWGIVGHDGCLCDGDNRDNVQRGRGFAIAVGTATFVDGRGLLRWMPW